MPILAFPARNLYSPQVRTTFHGLSAACGKVGAVIGTFMFPAVIASINLQAVFWVEVALSVVGIAVATFCISSKTVVPDSDLAPLFSSAAGADVDEEGTPAAYRMAFVKD